MDNDVLVDDSPEEPSTDEGFDALPKATQNELRKLRKEQQSLRARLQERDAELLTARFGEDVVALIPEEVTAYERRVELAEKYAERFGQPAGNEEAATERAPVPDEPQEGLKEREARLAVAGGSQPAGARPANSEMSGKEIRDLGKRDPAAAMQAIKDRFG